MIDSGTGVTVRGPDDFGEKVERAACAVTVALKSRPTADAA
jgi:hypothetical protein